MDSLTAHSPRVTVTCTKVAWIRDPHAPIGKPATGRLNCRCGNAPVSKLHPSQGNVTCACGLVYTYNGRLVQR